MSEIAGLQAIIGNASTIHTIEEPPIRKDYQTESAWQIAYDAWYVRVNYWRAQRTT